MSHQAIASGIRKIADGLQEIANGYAAFGPPEELGEVKAEPAPKKTRKKPAKKPVETAERQDDEPGIVIDKDAVRAALAAVATKHGRDTAKEIVATYCAGDSVNLSAIPEANYSAVMKACEDME